MSVLSCLTQFYVCLMDGLLNRIPSIEVNNWWYLHLTDFFIAICGLFYNLFAKRVLQAKEYALSGD